jgi:phosphatidylserine decarboxylase
VHNPVSFRFFNAGTLAMSRHKTLFQNPSLRHWLDKIRRIFFLILPHHAYGWVIYHFTKIKISWIKNLQITLFIKWFKIDTSEIEYRKPLHYPDFNAFFTRSILMHLRPLPDDSDLIVSPVDAHIMELGPILHDQLIHAKGVKYSLHTLLGGDSAITERYRDGSFINLYLSPSDYHRIHSPADCAVRRMIHIPGRAFPVAPWSSRSIPSLFTRNERAVSFLETSSGEIALVMIGALGVCSLETSWTGKLSPPHPTQVGDNFYEPPFKVPFLLRGDELGRFNLGSSVILLFPAGSAMVLPDLKKGQKVKVGQPLAISSRPKNANADPNEQDSSTESEDV